MANLHIVYGILHIVLYIVYCILYLHIMPNVLLKVAFLKHVADECIFYLEVFLVTLGKNYLADSNTEVLPLFATVIINIYIQEEILYLLELKVTPIIVCLIVCFFWFILYFSLV